MIVGQRYQLEQHLGTGGMGMVFSARRLSDQRPVALKLIASDYASNPTALARLAREAESAAAIDHPNVVRVLDIDLDEQGALFLAMERVEGQNLECPHVDEQLAKLIDRCLGPAEGRPSAEELLTSPREERTPSPSHRQHG